MFQTNQNKSLRSALLLGAATYLAIGTPAMAQESSGVETVVVTGSRIPQTGLYSSSPVTAVGHEEIQLSNTTSVETLLDSLPSVVAGQSSATSNGATGTATVDLRGLGENRTLVMIDGVRMQPGDAEAPAPDLDQIPAALVDHVEVLTGGASATYGSDALAGVVNFIMRKDYEGIELDAGYSVNQHTNDDSDIRAIDSLGMGGTFSNGGATGSTGPNPDNPVKLAPDHVLDGATKNATLIMGVNTPDGKGNIEVYAGYRQVDPVLQSQRDYSACSLGALYYGEVPGAVGFKGLGCMGSITDGPLQDSLLTLSGHNAFVGYPYGLYTPTLHSTNGDVSSAFGGAYNGINGYTFNFAPYNDIQRNDTRYNAGFFGHYDVSAHLELYTSFMFMDDKTNAIIAPSGAFFGHVYSVNCSNPDLGSHSPTDMNSGYNTFGCSAADGSPTSVNMIIGAREPGIGSRNDNLDHISYRFVEGGKGDIGNNWTYDLYAEQGISDLQEEYLNDASVSKIQNAINYCATPDTGCAPLDLFSGAGPSQAALNYIRAVGFEESSIKEDILSANLVGDLGAWGGQSPWAKSPIGVALGLEYRQDSLVANTDEEFQTGDLAGQGGTHSPSHGSTNVGEAFTELRIPLVQNVPFIEDLTFNGAYRYSSYNTAGATNTWKAGLEWQPVDDIKFRASQNHAVRAPNILELFAPVDTSLWGGADPCAGTTPSTSLLKCENTGVTPSEYGHIIPCPVNQCSAKGGGNPALKPEVSDTRTIGLVFTPTFFPNFTATVDYFDIKVGGAIGSIPESNTIAGCLNGVAALCSDIHRSPQGFLFGDEAYVTNTPINTGGLATKGIDFEANYTFDLDDLPSEWDMKGAGSLSANFVGTLTSVFDQKPYKAIPSLGIADPGHTDCAGFMGPICGIPDPHWRHKMRVTWDTAWDFSLSLNWRHIGDSQLDVNNTHNPLLTSYLGEPAGDLQDHIKTYNYFDLALNWSVTPKTELIFGVNNIMDKNPPVLDAANVGVSSNGNTFPQTYDALGRLLFVNVSLKN